MKFIYLADTHIGGSDTEGYRQQPRYLSRINELMDCFAGWIETRNDIDFIIHGGDIVENTTPENISYAAELFSKLPCPVYAALGNHDLTVDGSVNCWLDNAPAFFPGNTVDFSVSHKDIDFHFFTCHWGNKPYFWAPEEEQIPYLLPSQWEKLDSRKNKSSNPMVIITRSQIFGLPSGQTGFAEPLHAPGGEFASVVQEKTAGLPVILILGAHNHLNMNVEANGITHVTASAFTAIPFEFKIFEINDSVLSMKTIPLSGEVSFRSDYCFDKTFVQGRPIDRSFEKKFK